MAEEKGEKPSVNSSADGGSSSANIVGNYNTLFQSSYQMPMPTLGGPITNTLHFSTKRVESNDPALPYAMEVVIQTLVDLSPVSLAIVCSGPLGNIVNFTGGVFHNMLVCVPDLDAERHIGVVKYDYPPLTATKPLQVRIFSKGDVIVKEVVPAIIK